MIQTRYCAVCVISKPLTTRYFERSKNRSGFNYWCKECCSIRNRITYKKKRLSTFLERTVIPFEEEEKRIITNALACTQGDANRAAELLQIGRATIFRKLKQWKILNIPIPELRGIAQLKNDIKELQEEWASLISSREAKKKALKDKIELEKLKRQYEEQDKANRDAIIKCGLLD
jgi:hypothetical protein